MLTTAYQRYTEDGVNGLTSRSVTHHVKAVYATDSDRVRTHRKLSLSHFTVVSVVQRGLCSVVLEFHLCLFSRSSFSHLKVPILIEGKFVFRADDFVYRFDCVRPQNGGDECAGDTRGLWEICKRNVSD